MDLLSRTSIVASVALVLSATTFAAAGEQGAKPPRYQLQVGQELVYKSDSEFTYEGGKFRDQATWTVWVVRANKDGSWHLVLRHANAFSQGEIPNEQKTVSFAWCDLHPDGRFAANDPFVFRMQPYSFLARLPSGAGDPAQC